MSETKPEQGITGVKYDAHKPMMDLIPPLMEPEVARVLTVGAEKYSPKNWRHVPSLRERYTAAAKRHINALQQGIIAMRRPVYITPRALCAA